MKTRRNPPSTKPLRVPKSVGDVGEQLWVTIPGLGRTYLVDGEKVAKKYANFIGGGHHLWARFIPPHEFWVDKRLGKSGRYIAMHEWFEYLLMGCNNWKYEKAHNAANALEADLRNCNGTARSVYRITAEHLEKYLGSCHQLAVALTKGFCEY